MTVMDEALDPGSTGKSTETDPSLSKDNAQEFIPPKDGSWVPRERLNKMNARIDDLSKQLEKQEKEQNAPKPVPRKELLAKVDVGEITQAEADEVWQHEIETRVADQVETVVRDTAAATKLQEELTAYEKSVPELSDENSELYANVAREYNYLTQTLGMPDTTSTTILAVRSIVGPAHALKTVDIKKQTGDGHPENSGSGDGGKNSTGSKIQMTDRQKDYYRNGIRNGAYADWDAAHKELAGYNA